MSSTPELLADYLESVAGEIRWPRARRYLLRELRDHIDDQSRDYQESSMGDSAALEKAIAEMGDPLEVGRELNRLHHPRNAWGAAILVLVLAVAGLVLAAALPSHEIFYYARCQLIGLVLGTGILFGLWFADYTFLLKHYLFCVVIFFVVLLFLIPLYSHYRYGISTYLQFRPLIYPMLLTPILFAGLICRLRGRKHGSVALCGVLAVFLSLPPPCVPSMTTALYLAFIMTLLLAYAVWTGWFSVPRLSGLACACAPAFLCAVRLFYFFVTSGRLQIALHPELDPLNRGFLAFTVQTIFRSLPVVNYSGGTIPSDYNQLIYDNSDFLLLQLATRFGSIICLFALILICVLLGLAVWRIRKLHSRQGRFLAIAALSLLAAEGLGYLLYNCGFVLISPIAFPFLSYGIAALVLNFGLLGIILSIVRMDTLVRDIPPKRKTNKFPDSFTIPLPFRRGKIHIEYKEI